VDALDAGRLDRDAFVARFGGVFEHSPWVAGRVVDARPFASVAALHAAMAAAVRAEGEAAQLALLRAHPELASKAASAGELTADSAREQDAAGLRQCSAEELEALQRMNAQYGEIFGFPFIVAVRGLDRAGILERLAERLHNDRATEFDGALRQVERIAALRLQDLLDDAGR
jgi:2-oxo-4-hydroxy-4-carboxy-5-ureidoimidazoline decarboxylase